MRGRLRRFLTDSEGVGRGGSWGALGRCISRHVNAGSVHISANGHSKLYAFESSGVKF